MPQVNFYLKEPQIGVNKSKQHKTLIYLQFKYSGYRMVFAFGQKVFPYDWNFEKQRVKNNKQTTSEGDYSLNSLLEELEKVCDNAYKKEIKDGIPQPDTLKGYLVAYMNKNQEEDNKPTLYDLIEQFISGEITYKGKQKVKGTLLKYKTSRNYLKAFELKTRHKVDFETINLDFFYKYVSFLRSKDLAQNTISKQIDHIKTFMNEAFDLKLTRNVEHKNKKFSAATEEVEAVSLSDQEILKLFNYNLSKDKKLEQVRDLFVFGSYVGLRFSDFSDVKHENIVKIGGQKFIKMITRKTSEQVVIPCNPIVLQIFDKYSENKNNLPRSISNQKFNEYIKLACKEAKLNETGRLSTCPDKELWQLISSHTARRSFATNLYLEGFPPFEIMKITGHKTEKSFLTYLKVSKLDAAQRLSKHMQLRWSEKLLKVAS